MPDDFLSPWYTALADPIGFAFETDDRELARAKLYKARGARQDPDLAILSVVLPANNPNEIWIIRNALPTS